ncbi:MAG: DUF234 domain-containing protein [Candidatus Aminicenantes bacterium]|jgi:hypothetical protein
MEVAIFDYVKQIVNRDHGVFSGRGLEIFFRQLFADSHRYNRIGSYWERGNQNEIDLVAVNDMEKKIVILLVRRPTFVCVEKAAFFQRVLNKVRHGLDGPGQA